MKTKTQKPLRIRIKVTQRHIDMGCESSPENCPVAIACREAVTAYFEASPLGRALLPKGSVVTRVTAGDELGLTFTLMNGAEFLRFVVATLKEEKHITDFIDAFDDELSYHTQALGDMLDNGEPRSDIRHQRAIIRKLERDILPFSFWVVLDH